MRRSEDRPTLVAATVMVIWVHCFVAIWDDASPGWKSVEMAVVVMTHLFQAVPVGTRVNFCSALKTFLANNELAEVLWNIKNVRRIPSFALLQELHKKNILDLSAGHVKRKQTPVHDLFGEAPEMHKSRAIGAAIQGCLPSKIVRTIGRKLSPRHHNSPPIWPPANQS
jgi:hypothetical protein